MALNKASFFQKSVSSFCKVKIPGGFGQSWGNFLKSEALFIGIICAQCAFIIVFVSFEKLKNKTKIRICRKANEAAVCPI